MRADLRSGTEPRSEAEHRRGPTIDALAASASAEGAPHLSPRSFGWDGDALIMATPADSPTGGSTGSWPTQGATTKGAGMSALDQLLGTWEFSMQHSAMSEPVTGRQRYERVLNGAFVLQHWTYDHPDFPDAMALLSDDRCHYFDVRGIVRIFDLEFHDGGWSMIHLDEDFSQRYTARFRGPDVMDSTGERSDDAGVTWRHDFTMTYQRIT